MIWVKPDPAMWAEMKLEFLARLAQRIGTCKQVLK